MVSSGIRPQPTVFISYAHESDALCTSVKALADWLSNHGCMVLTDHAYRFRPPDVGWQAWMLDCIDKAETVLVVCTPKLKLRYEKNAPLDSGRGATYEGAIVTQHLYDNAMRNTKFYPILPDDLGREEDIPTTIKAWWNGHRFLSGNEGILRMILGDAAVLRSDVSDDAPPPAGDNHHRRLAVELLKAVEGTPFFQALVHELAAGHAGQTGPTTSEQIVRWFSRCAPAEDDVRELFYAVRRALQDAPSPQADLPLRRRCEEAAAALYCLAAACLVVRASQPLSLSYTVGVPSSEAIICAVIATGLFGGQVRLKPLERGDLPAAEYVFEVHTAFLGDQPVGDFERAAYLALFENDATATDISTYDGPLHERDRERLAARLRTIQKIRRASLCFVVRADFSENGYQHFGATHRVPVMVPDSAATSELLGMSVETLLAEIREFWAELEVMRGKAYPAHPSVPPSAPEKGAAMSQSGPIIQIGTVSGGVAVSTGSHSPTQTGTGHTASIDHREGADLAALIPLLQELAREIGAHPSAAKRDALTAHVELAQHEADKKNAADPGRIKRALDVIKSGAEGLEQGGRILALCHKAYNVLAPLLNLPSSPLP